MKPFVTPILAGLVIGIITVFVVKPEPITNVLRANHLLPEPEKLTELYFEDHTKLPSTIVPGQEETFRFTIHNLEYQPMSYPYSVVVETATGSSVVNVGSIDLAHDAKKTFTQDISFPEATRTAVIVRLDNNAQIIRFWLNNYR
jgi:hypothetical protein